MTIAPLPEALLALPDEQLGAALWNWWVAYTVDKRGIPSDQVTPEMIASIRAASLSADGDDPEDAALEKVVRLAASGALGRAGRMLRVSVIAGAIQFAAADEAQTGRRKQRAIAAEPRPDGLQVLIEQIVTELPGIKQAQLLEVLRAEEHGEVIDSINNEDQIIEWRDENHPSGTSPISGLKDRLRRARRKIKSR